MATKAKKRAADKDTTLTEDQVVHDLDVSTIGGDLDDDEAFFQDIDLLQNHGIVSL